MRVGIDTSENGQTAVAPQPRLVKAAQAFEGMMLKELLKPMTAGDGLTGEDGTNSGGALGEYATESLGQALSQRGGFGIANRIVSSLSHSGTAGAVAPMAGR